MNLASPKRRKRPSEDGYMLVAVIFMMAILILSLSIAIPRVRESIQRDREEETMYRGKQYIRAVQLYYRKFHAYPPNIDALVKTNDIRFLRKKYIDPTTGKDEWKPVLFGQNKTPQAMGFFGQPLAAAIGGGIGPAGGNTGINGSPTGIGAGGVGSAGGGMFGSSTIGGSTIGSSAGSTTDPGATTAGQNGTTGGSTTGVGGPTGSTSAFGSSSNPTGTGQSFGGGGIIGFSPQSPRQSILVYKKKNHYNEWEFLYSPQSDMGMMGMMPPAGIQPSQPGVGAPGTTFSPPGATPAPTQPTPQPQQ